MVYPGSQVQWVVPWVRVQRDGRTWEPAVAAGRVEAAAVSDMFVMVMKTGGGGKGWRKRESCFHIYSIAMWGRLETSREHTPELLWPTITPRHTTCPPAGVCLFNSTSCFRGQFDWNIKASAVWLWMCCLHVGRGVWQVGPDQPLPHTQENWFTSSTHVPPLRHGDEAHSLVSGWKEEGRMAKVDFCIWAGTAEQMQLSCNLNSSGAQWDTELIHWASVWDAESKWPFQEDTDEARSPRQDVCWPLQLRLSWQTLLSEPPSSKPGSHRKWTSWPTLCDRPSFLPLVGASSFGQVSAKKKKGFKKH